MQRGGSVRELCGRVVQTMTASIVVLWVLTIVCTRIYLFHNAYIHQLQTVEDEKYLLQQCENETFVARLRQHVVLCQLVQENARRTPFLVALNETMTLSSLCGPVACMDIVYYIQTGGISLVTLVCVACLGLVIVVLPTANVVARWVTESSAWNQPPCVEHGYDMALPAVRDEGWGQQWYGKKLV